MLKLIERLPLPISLLLCIPIGMTIGGLIIYCIELNFAASVRSMGAKPTMHGLTCYVPNNGTWMKCQHALTLNTIPVTN